MNNKLEMSMKIAKLHEEAVERRKEEFIEEIMKCVHCHESDRESVKRLIGRSFDEGAEAFVKTEIEIMEALEEEGVL